MYKLIIKPLLFKFQPETIHNFTFLFLKLLKKIPFTQLVLKKLFLNNKNLEKTICGLNFKNPIGLAAGLDKNAEVFDVFSNFGFGFVEIGTITPKPQQGNPKPRLFRLIKDQALINRMGFNNKGIDEIIKNIKKIDKSNIILGANIGKNTSTSNKNAINDYATCFEKLHNFVNYFTVNVSCPNVNNLSNLQSKDSLLKILVKLQEINNSKLKLKPIFLKISPDINKTQLNDILEVVKQTKINGIVATNTTTSRNNLITNKKEINNIGNGGLSGKPLKNNSTKIIKYLRNKNKEIIIIGVGGIMTENDAIEKINAGANLIQLYSGFIYKGPKLINKIKKKLLAIT